jgi:kynureninase
MLSIYAGVDLIRSWNKHGWLERQFTAGAKIARLVGGGDKNIIVSDATSVNLFKLLVAAMKLRPGRTVVLSERGNFPTDIYIIQGILDQMDNSHQLKLVQTDCILSELQCEASSSIAVVCLTHVNFKTGSMHDMAALTAAAHACGALILWDLSHSAGAVELDLLGADVDFAVGCGYKYLNGGPGAPSFLFVHPRLQHASRSPLTGK